MNYTLSDFNAGLSADQLSSSLKAAQQEQEANKECSILAEEMEKTRREVAAVNNTVKETTASVNTLNSTISQTRKDINNGYKVIIPPETIEHQMQVLGTFEKEFVALIGKKMEEVTTKMKEDNKDFFRELDRFKRQIQKATDKVFLSQLTAWWVGINLGSLIVYFAINVYLSFGEPTLKQFIVLCQVFLVYIVVVNILIFLYHLWDKRNERERRY